MENKILEMEVAEGEEEVGVVIKGVYIIIVI